MFESISGRDGGLDVEEYVRWLNEEWRRQQRATRAEKVQRKAQANIDAQRRQRSLTGINTLLSMEKVMPEGESENKPEVALAEQVNTQGAVEVAQLPTAVKVAEAPRDVMVAEAPRDMKVAEALRAVEVAQLEKPGAVEVAELPTAVKVAEAPRGAKVAKAPRDVKVAEAPRAVEVASEPGELGWGGEALGAAEGGNIVGIAEELNDHDLHWLSLEGLDAQGAEDSEASADESDFDGDQFEFVSEQLSDFYKALARGLEAEPPPVPSHLLHSRPPAMRSTNTYENSTKIGSSRRARSAGPHGRHLRLSTSQAAVRTRLVDHQLDPQHTLLHHSTSPQILRWHWTSSTPDPPWLCAPIGRSHGATSAGQRSRSSFSIRSDGSNGAAAFFGSPTLHYRPSTELQSTTTMFPEVHKNCASSTLSSPPSAAQLQRDAIRKSVARLDGAVKSAITNIHRRS